MDKTRNVWFAKRRKCEIETESGRDEDIEVLGGDCLVAVANERRDLEKFLFDEGNKVSRPVIRHILEKWAIMEARLQSALVEIEILKERNKRVDLPAPEKLTYAQTAAMRMHEPRPQGAGDPRKKVSPPKEKYEVVLIKPEKEDKRNNEQIKGEVIKKLEGVRSKLKVRNIRQMRKQGVLIEVVDNKDVETINACDSKKEGFLVERPKKVNPSIIIYDVEKEYKEEDLKENLIRKNLGEFSDTEVTELTNDIKFVHNFKVKDEKRVNWVVQLPAKYYSSILNKGRIFMMWRSYRTREYVNITRCNYKCHGYGHVAASTYRRRSNFSTVKLGEFTTRVEIDGRMSKA